jgi:hypothetical protein
MEKLTLKSELKNELKMTKDLNLDTKQQEKIREVFKGKLQLRENKEQR